MDRPMVLLGARLLIGGVLAALRDVDRIDVDHVVGALATHYAVFVAVAGGHLVRAVAGAYVVVAVVALHIVVARVAVDVVVP